MLKNRREFIKSVGAGLLVTSIGFSKLQPETKPNKKRNILLYVTDDHGRADAGCYGNPVIHTPGLDMLAADGTKFTNAFCTTASCSPSRSVILSGKHNHCNGQYGLKHGYHHFQSFDDVTTLPNILAQTGYRTTSVGKYHVAPEQAFHFEQYIPKDSPIEMAKKCDDVINSDSDKPFFLYFCTYEPHRPFRNEGSKLIDPADVIVPSFLPDTPECRAELARYYGSVERADKGLLELIKMLKAAGRYDDTLIIYCSDNGIAFPGAKTTVYEPGLNLPFVVRNPYSKKKNLTTDAMVSYVDIVPTILNFAGIAPQDYDLHGRSFLPAVADEHPVGFDEVYASHTFHEVTMYYPMRVLRERRYKLIWNIAHQLEYPFASDLYASDTWQGVLNRGDKYFANRPVNDYLHRPAFELYDLQSDPDEVNNLADDPKYAQRLTNMKAKLKAFQQKTKDPWILKWQHQ
jgi:N-sulfoglucosamine sulfohydrolase